jgi:hypothetical protein
MNTEPTKPLRDWLDWQPKEAITADSPQGEPTKPSKPSFVSFVGSLPDDSQKIDTQDEPLTRRRRAERIEVAVDSVTEPERGQVGRFRTQGAARRAIRQLE